MRFLVALFFLAGCTSSDLIKEVKFNNPASLERSEVLGISIPEGFSSENFGVRFNGEILPVELIDSNDDGIKDAARLLLSFQPNEEKTLQLVKVDKPLTPEKLTQSEISVKQGGEWKDREYIGGDFVNLKSLDVPQEHTDHSWYIRYEGPGWESNKVAYRFYLDWRNGIDIFGKKTGEPILQKVGLDGFDSYHEEAEWGLDVLKVGKSLGMGSIGRYLNDSLYRFQSVEQVSCTVSDGILSSSVITEYKNWVTEQDTTTIVSNISINADSRITKHALSFTNAIEGFCTGLVQNEGEEYIEMDDGDFQLIATYGDYSLNNDQLGMAVIVNKKYVNEVSDAANSHMITFVPKSGLTYYLLAAWEKEPNGIKDLESFKTYLSEVLVKLNNPIKEG